MSCGLAPGLGPLLLATEAQTRSLWLFLGRAAEVKVKLTWQNRWWHCWRPFRNSRTLYRPSQQRPKPPQVRTPGQPRSALRRRACARRRWPDRRAADMVLNNFRHEAVHGPAGGNRYTTMALPLVLESTLDPPRPGRARVAFLSYVWCGTPLTLCFHGVRDTLCIGWEVGYRRGHQSVKL